MIEKMKKNWAALSFIFVLVSTGVAGAGYGLPILQEIAANTSWRIIQTFERLDLIKSKRKLSIIEWQKWCKAGQQLKVFKRCPRR